jgi:hypothetical protein
MGRAFSTRAVATYYLHVHIAVTVSARLAAISKGVQAPTQPDIACCYAMPTWATRAVSVQGTILSDPNGRL